MRNKWVALILCILLGYFVGHKFYEGKAGMGILYIFTFGLFGIGVIVDFITILLKPNPYYVSLDFWAKTAVEQRPSLLKSIVDGMENLMDKKRFKNRIMFIKLAEKMESDGKRKDFLSGKVDNNAFLW